jgi:phosphoenolpyruvate carboxykinase (GTP)
MGATLASETTAAATGAVGVLRRDPFAMLPFCGYDMADYFGHWLQMGREIAHPPRIYRVNWFRRGPGGEFLWPGFGQNLRVLQWIIQRCAGTAGARETAVGLLPSPGDIDLDGLGLSPSALDTLFGVRPEEWQDALKSQTEFLGRYGNRMPAEMWQEHDALEKRLQTKSA